MNARTRLIASIGIPVLLILLVVGAFLWQQRSSAGTTPAPAGTQKLIPMRLALDWTPNTNHTGIYVALKKGWYRDAGIDLQLLPYSASVSPDVLVSSGKADVGIGATEGIVADAAVSQPVVSIAAIIQHNTSALVTLASSGLSRPRDLSGKIYGGFGASYEPAVVGEIIKRDGGTGQFKNVTLDVDAMQALESHRVDFAWVFEGWEVIQAQRAGVKLNIFPITNYGVADYYTPNIIASPNEIKQKSELLHRFMAATAKGYEYARTHAQDAAQILLSPRYADTGRKWGWQDAAVWHGYPQFIINTGGIVDAGGHPVHSMDFESLYTNQFLP